MSLSRVLHLTLRVWRVLRFTEFDTTTSEGQFSERYRRVVLSVAAAMTAKAATGLSTLISVPLTLRYLGSERYGYWMAIVSGVGMFAFADLGIGSALLNRLSSPEVGAADRAVARAYISSALFLLLGVISVLGAALALLFPLIPLSQIFEISPWFARGEAAAALAVMAVCFLLALPCGVVQRVQLSSQEGFINSYWEAAGTLLALLLLLVVIASEGGLPTIIAVVSGIPVIVTVLNGLYLFLWKRPWLAPSIRSVNAAASIDLLRVGGLFLILQQATTLAFLSDNFIVGWLLGTDAVTQYSVPMRLFSLAPVLVNLFLLPLWPAYADAMRQRHFDWARRMVTRSALIAVLVTGGPALFLVVFGRPIIRIWAGPELQPSVLLLSGIGLWTVAYALGSSLMTFLTGAGILLFQVKCIVVTAFTAVLAKIVLARAVGIEGVVLGTLVAYILFSLAPFYFFVHRMFGRLEKRLAE